MFTEEIKKLKETLKENKKALLEDIENIMENREVMDFCTPDGELIADDVAIGFEDKETGTFPKIDAVVKRNGEIYLQCNILGSDYEIWIKDVEVSYEDLITIASGMHKVLEWEEDKKKGIYTAFEKDDWIVYDAFMKFVKDFYAPTDYKKAMIVEDFMNTELTEVFKKAKEKFGK